MTTTSTPVGFSGGKKSQTTDSPAVFVSTKQCPVCERTLSLDSFNKDASMSDGRKTQCTLCRTGRNDPREYLYWKYNDMQGRVTGVKNSTRKTNSWVGKPIVARAEFIDWALGQAEFYRLWTEWQEAGRPRRLTPSVDRIDVTGGYTLDNMRFVPLYANRPTRI